MVPSQMSKGERQQWRTEPEIPWAEQWLRARLMQEVERYREKKPLVELCAEEQGHKGLFLPVHHPEFNPLELVWATVKHEWGTLFSHSTSCKEQRQHLEESFTRDITPEYWTKVYDQVQKIAERYWHTDLLLDEEIEIGDDELSQ